MISNQKMIKKITHFFLKKGTKKKQLREKDRRLIIWFIIIHVSYFFSFIKSFVLQYHSIFVFILEMKIKILSTKY